jgi:hypothetical protein
MILKTLTDLSFSNFPVVIFGSGPAGVSVSLQLEKYKIRTLLIEAGGEQYTDLSQQFYEINNLGDKLEQLEFSRLRQFGGTSGHWGGWSKPLESYHLKDWLVKHGDLSKYQEQTSKILEIKNDYKKTLIDKNFYQVQFGYSKVRFYEKYYKHIKSSNYIFLALNTQLSHFNNKDNLITEAVCHQGNYQFKIKSNYFILCCGGIENSRIMLWSEEKNKIFGKQMPLGKYWMTHPYVVGGAGIIYMNNIKEKLGDNFINVEETIHFGVTEELVNKNKILSGQIYLIPSENTYAHKEIIKEILCLAPELGKKIAKNLIKKTLICGNINMILEDKPEETNQIRLNYNNKDLLNIPTSTLYYKKSNEVLLSSKLIMEQFAEMCIKNDFGRVAIKKDIYELKTYGNMGSNHHIGGTRIGSNEKTSVVDSNLKVHNTKNLYISGSSVFPTAGYENPTFTIIQLSLRLADHIKKEINI